MFFLLFSVAIAGSTHRTFDAQLERESGARAADGANPLLMVLSEDHDWISMESTLPSTTPVADKEPWARAGPPIDAPGATDGFLNGKAIYGSQCHGWIWYDSLGRFSTQRGNVHDTVEDFHNPEGMNQYLFRYLENAGAAVFATKERDHNPNMAIADNDGAGYSESGEGFEDGALGFADLSPWAYGDDPFDAGSTRRFPADGGSVASWIPEAPADGMFAVYVAWDSAADNTEAAHYRLIHNGGVIDRWFDQRVHGSTWQYVDTLFLPKGIGGLEVQLVADSDESGVWLSADAVRIGGGMGDVTRHGVTTERPRHEEGAILYNQFNGAPTSVYDPWGDGDGSDPATRSRWADWEHPSGEDALYLSWHSNAFDGTARGTVTYTYSGDYGSGVTGSVDFADALQDEMISSINTLWSTDWNDRGLKTAAFSEVNPNHNDEMPAALVELAFHDNVDDTAFLKEPAFRNDMSRAMYRGIVRYFAERDGQTPAFLPEPPTHLSLRHSASGQLVARWETGVAGDPFGDDATGYRVYSSVDGRSWDNGTTTTSTHLQLDTSPGDSVFVRVTATNLGGESFASETIGARHSPDGWAPVLIVSAFDRLEASNLVWDSIGGSLGDVVRMPLERINNFDTSIASAASIVNAGWYFDTVSDERFGDLDLSDYRLIIWVAGEESTADETFDSEQQAVVRTFVDEGGAIWASGAEIAWDLDYRGDAADRAFADEVLGIAMESDDAGTTEVDGLDLLAGLLLDFGEDLGAPYPVEYPDVLRSTHTVIASYSDGSVAAVMGEGVAVFGFPFECIGDVSVRDAVVARLLPELVPDYTPPDIDSGGGDDDDSGSPVSSDSGEIDDTGVGPEGAAAPSSHPPDLGKTKEEKGCQCSTTVPTNQQTWIWLLTALLMIGHRRRAKHVTPSAE